MGSEPRSYWGRWVALLAAWLTAFQLALAVPALATVESGNGLGPSVICGHISGEHGQTPARVPAHLRDCCFLGCPMSGALLAPPVAVAVPPFHAFSAVRLSFGRGADGPALRRKGSPRLSRGPPPEV